VENLEDAQESTSNKKVACSEEIAIASKADSITGEGGAQETNDTVESSKKMAGAILDNMKLPEKQVSEGQNSASVDHAGYELDLSFAVLAYLQSNGFEAAAAEMVSVLQQRHADLQKKVVRMGSIHWRPLFADQDSVANVEPRRPPGRSKSNEELTVPGRRNVSPVRRVKRSVSFSDDNLLTRTHTIPRYTIDEKLDLFYDKNDLARFKMEEQCRQSEEQAAMLDAMLANSILGS